MGDQLHDDQALMRELCEIESGLTAWEMERVEEWSALVERRPLSDKQRAVAMRILEEKG